MSFANILRLAIRSINRNKLRSFLTMLGIIIGVAAVIAMLAVGQGSRDAINSQIASLGTNVILIFPGSVTKGGVRTEAGAAANLTEADALATGKNCPAVKAFSPIVRQGSQVKYQNQNWRTNVTGTYPSYLEIRDWAIEEGNIFSESDLRSASKVCVLGQTVIQNLYGLGINPVGTDIRIRNVLFKVIGTLAAKGQNALGQDQDDVILAPFSTVQKKIMGITFANSLIASATTPDQIEEARAEIKQTLLDRRGRNQGDTPDFTIRTQTDIGNAAEETSKTLSILLASIASVSLLVGGIGIMNIMLVSVTERTREIGIRMAVGARSRDVLWQFLVEALGLSFVGGLLGILLGLGVCTFISSLQDWPIKVSWLSIAFGFGFSAAIGIFFGWFPARKAAKLNPIEALRYE